jgi:hypothetical protein
MVKNIHLATFAQDFKNLLNRLATVQATQLAYLFFTTEPNDDNNYMHLNLLNRLVSLSVFPQEFTKVHLNASFQSVDLEVT